VKITRFEVKKAVIFILAINIIQVGVLILLLLYSFFSPESFYIVLGSSSRFFLAAFTVFSLVNGFISIRDTYLLVHTDSQYHLIQDTLSRVENLNNSLRAQRHDFLNHLQVVYGLMEMDEYADARDYIEKVYHDIQKVSRVLKTANPAVNALLQAKLLDAEKKGIKMQINVTSRFITLPIPSWELCRVLANLLDNAIFALEEKESDRLIKVELGEDLKSFIIRVEDNGPGVPGKHLEKIFHPGFTTKGEHGEGMGLAISKEILTQYGGSIHVESGNGSTLFTGYIPKQL